MKEQDLKEIKQKAVIDADPEFVFDAYTDPVKHAEFTGSPASGKPKVGGKFSTWDGYSGGKYVKLERGKKIVHEWTTTDWPAGYPPSIVEITLRKVGKKTELTMVQSKVPAEQVEDYRQGWLEWYWKPLKEYAKGKSSKS